MITRRKFTATMVGGSIAGIALGALAKTGRIETGQDSRVPLARKIERDLAQIEVGVGGRLGVAIRDTSTGFRAGRRMDERFPMCSTFKFLVAAAVLARVDEGRETLARRVVFSAADLVSYSPITGKQTGGAGMSLAELCEAAVTLSDNTAANLLLANLGGPAGLTAFARGLGDDVTRLDRIEPMLNEAVPGDPRDTTTPTAMLGNMRELLLGKRLSPSSRDQLQAWLVANKTGDARIRAKLPQDWRVGDKTGTGQRGTSNDVAILWPPGRAPILVSVYLTEAKAGPAKRDAAIANVGAIMASLS